MDALDARRRQRSRSSSPFGSGVKRQRTSSSGSEILQKATLANGQRESNGDAMSLPPPGDGNLRPLSLSILGVEPLDEFIREIADWIYELIMRRPEINGQIEVEAKLGVLKFREADMRLNHPVRVETILKEDENNRYEHRFESNMSAAQHKHFNTLLNGLEEKSRLPGASTTTPLRHQHSYLLDSFYPDLHGGRDGDKIRVTTDERTNEVKECVRKIRLGNLDIFSPKRHADWRVSVNLEAPVSPPKGQPSFVRRKDRMSYSHEEFVIDLTQVTQTSGPQGQSQIMHELEIEFARPAILLSAAAVRGDPNAPPLERDAFDELIRAFVNNVRILVRNAKPT